MEIKLYEIYHIANKRTGDTSMRKNSTKGFMALFMVAITVCSMLCGCAGTNQNGKNLTEKYGKDVNELTIPDNVRVIGFGEATHGNADFQ